MKKFLLFTLFVFVLMLGACYVGKYDAAENALMIAPSISQYDMMNDEKYLDSNELPVVSTDVENESYFSMDSSTASYQTMKRDINNGSMDNYNKYIRTDELLNYFSYDFGDSLDTFTSYSELSKTPWSESSYLLAIGIKTKKAVIERYSQGNNFVFLIDVSGSMAGQYRLGLVKEAILLLLENIDKNDKISIVTYANGVETVCSGLSADSRKLPGYINGLSAAGGTSGGDGLKLAYKCAQDNLISGGNNRVIICSDGDFNIGANTTDQIKEIVSSKKELGIYTTVLGFGMGNYRDDIMQTIANNGNGVLAFINDLKEAKRVLIDNMDNTLYTVAKDVKSKVVFNKDVVKDYRLIGYESKTITKEDYQDDTKDALDLGSNTTTFIVYEINLNDEIIDLTSAKDFVTLDIKYKDPITDENLTYSNTFSDLRIKDYNATTEDYRFACAVVEFSLIYRDSEYKYNSSINHVKEELEKLECVKNDEYKKEFLELVNKYISLLQ